MHFQLVCFQLHVSVLFARVPKLTRHKWHPNLWTLHMPPFLPPCKSCSLLQALLCYLRPTKTRLKKKINKMPPKAGHREPQGPWSNPWLSTGILSIVTRTLLQPLLQCSVDGELTTFQVPASLGGSSREWIRQPLPSLSLLQTRSASWSRGMKPLLPLAMPFREGTARGPRSGLLQNPSHYLHS